MKIVNPRVRSGFGMVSKSVMTNPLLSLRDKALYAYLCVYANNVDNELTVSVNRMAAECGVTQSTIKRSLKVLENHGVIQRITNDLLVTRKTIILK